jgi:hypothetical protein
VAQKIATTGLLYFSQHSCVLPFAREKTGPFQDGRRNRVVYKWLGPTETYCAHWLLTSRQLSFKTVEKGTYKFKREPCSSTQIDSQLMAQDKAFFF